jgi:hypothetical protein
MMILGYIKPFLERRATILEYFNECMIQCILYCMIAFTDFVRDMEAKIQVGYVCCALIGLHLAVNLGLMLLDNLKLIRMSWIRFRNG